MHLALSKEIFVEQTQVLTPEYCLGRGWLRNSCEFPLVDVTYTLPGRIPLRLQLECSRYDEKAPSVSLHSAEGALLTSIHDRRYNGVFNPGPHPVIQRPFICMRGANEYHTHPSHIADLWESLRGKPDFSIAGLLYQLHLAWLKEGV